MKNLIIAFCLLLSSQAFAWEMQSEFACTINNQLIAWMVTPFRPMGAATPEDMELAKNRCEFLGGQLGNRKPQPGPPTGAASPVINQ